MGLSEEPQVEVGEEGTSYAVLVGVVSTTAPVPFVMARLVELEHDALAEKGKGGKTPEHAELHSDLRAKLAEVGEAMSRVLQVMGAEPTEPADRWDTVVGSALHMDRAAQDRALLAKLAVEGCGGDSHRLAIARPTVEPGMATFPVMRASDGATLGIVRWPSRQYEDWQETMHHFMELLTSVGVGLAFDHEDVHPPDSPCTRVAPAHGARAARPASLLWSRLREAPRTPQSLDDLPRHHHFGGCRFPVVRKHEVQEQARKSSLIEGDKLWQRLN